MKTVITLFRTAVLLCAVAFSAALSAHEGPTMGWSSWNTYRVNISDSIIMRQADLLVGLGLDSVGYRFINIDDGFFGGRDSATGRLRFHPERFPRGLKPVVDHIHSLGLKAGIYSDAGANTCGNFWDRDSIARGVGLYGHDLEDCRLYFSELGFDFIKVDFCGGDPRQNTDSLRLIPEERYRAIRRAIDAVGRGDVRMNVCRWDFPGVWVSDVASSWRISHDIGPSWGSVKDIIGQNLYLSAYARDGHYNDMDMLELGRGLTPDEERTHFGLWCMMSSPLLIGCDLGALPRSTLSLLKNRALVALDQDTLALQAYVAARHGGCYVLVKDVERRFSTTRAVALYNSTDSVRELTLDFRDVDLAGKVRLTNLFDGKVTEVADGSLAVSLRPHSTEIFRAEADRRLPRTRFEAETAWLPLYQELENPLAAHTAFYEADESCSGGMKVANAGGRRGNGVLFRDVHSATDTGATLTVRCRSVSGGSMEVWVNGSRVAMVPVAASDEFTDVKVDIPLRGGLNEVLLDSPESPLAEIDYIDINRAV